MVTLLVMVPMCNVLKSTFALSILLFNCMVKLVKECFYRTRCAFFFFKRNTYANFYIYCLAGKFK